MEFAQHPRIQRYPENNVLSKIDVRITTFLSNLPLTSIPFLTFIPFLFGHSFGAPLISLVTLPPLLFSDHPLVRIYSVTSTISWLLVFYYNKSRKVLENPTLILTGMFGTFILAVHLQGNALDAYCAYLCSWFYSTVVCFLGKTFFLRARPGLKAAQDKTFGTSSIERSTTWNIFSKEHAADPNGYLSFPSFDSACAACFCTTLYLQHHYEMNAADAPLWLWCIVPLACFGRIYFRAHHFVDVIVGATLGCGCAAYVHFIRLSTANNTGETGEAGDASGTTLTTPYLTSPLHHYDVVWLIICIISIGLFFAVPQLGPFFAVIVSSIGFIFLPTTSLNSIVGTMWLGSMFWWVFERQSRAHKPWVVQTLEAFFKQHPLPPNELCPSNKTYPKHLSELLDEKRNEFLNQAKNTDEAHPGNLYVIHQFRYNKRMKAMREQGGLNVLSPKDNVYLVCGWNHLYELLEIRIEHFLNVTNTTCFEWDVIVGIYSGGAIIAPFVSSIIEKRRKKELLLNETTVSKSTSKSTAKSTAKSTSTAMPVCYIKCSRYDTCNMDPISLTKVTLDVALGKHDEQYKISKPPKQKDVEGKRCLMIDDASVSGGTFRATAKYLIHTLNAKKDVKGLALCDFNGVTHIYDPNRDNDALGPVTVQKLDVGTFTPWGTF